MNDSSEISDTRKSVFISHAALPKDQAFTVWLGSRLSATGYSVWADVLKLKGGDRWQRVLDWALRTRTRIVLVVCTNEGVHRQGVERELIIADGVSKKQKIESFIIPLRLAPYEAPFTIADLQYIDFAESWTQGLHDLLERLEELAIPKRPVSIDDARITSWKQTQLRLGRPMVANPESLISNWGRFSQLPDKLKFYDFLPGVSIGAKDRALREVNLAVRPHKRGFVSFLSFDQLSDAFGPSLPIKFVGQIDTTTAITDGWESESLRFFDARNMCSHLIREAIEDCAASAGFRKHELSGGRAVWWRDLKTGPLDQITYQFEQGIAGRRKIIGTSKKLHWHFGISLVPQLQMPARLLFGAHVLFSENGINLLPDGARQNGLKRSRCKSWRNDRWLGLMLATLSLLRTDQGKISIPFEDNGEIEIALPPILFEVDKSPDFGQFDVPDDPANDDYDDDSDVIDEYNDG